jgi:hypothetical protein
MAIIQCQYPSHCTIYVRNISGTIESDLEWPTPTNDVRPIVTESLRMVALES